MMGIRLAVCLLVAAPAFGDGPPGVLMGALVVYPPYEGALPALTFRFANGQTRTVALGEAVVTKRDARGLTVPVAWKFVGCERDGLTGTTYFVFDVDCDGQRIVELDSKRRVVRPWRPKSRYVALVNGVRRPTAEGWIHLARRYRELLDDVKLEVYRDARRTGLRIVRIRPRSVVHELGLKAGDVVLTLNGHLPRNGQHVLALVRRELRRKVLSVRILRGADVLELLFDVSG